MYLPEKLYSRQGYTVIEILAAVAVLAILAVLIIVAIGRVRESSESAVCASNLRTLAVAAILYGNDRGGALPDVILWRDSRLEFNNWSLVSYLDDGKLIDERRSIPPDATGMDTVFTCPAAQSSGVYAVDHWMNQTYAINVFMIGSNHTESGLGDWRTWSVTQPIAWNMANVHNPPQTPFFMDGSVTRTHHGTTGARYSTFTNPGRANTKAPPSPNTSFTTPYLHPGQTVSIVYVDGNVQRVTRNDVVENLNWTGK